MNTLSTSGYSAQLRQHSDLIKRVGLQYMVNGRVDWKRAIQSDPDTANKLLVGDGPLDSKIKRISNVWLRLKQSGKVEGLPQAAYPKTPKLGVHGANCALFDQHAAEIRDLVGDNRHPSNGKVLWQEALDRSPQLAKAIGFPANGQDRKPFLAVLSFWYRDRERRRKHGLPIPGTSHPHGLVPRPQPQHIVVGEPAPAPVPAPQRQLSMRFCPQCGNALLAHALASDIVAAMTASGLSQEQIVETLTRAAGAVARLAPAA